MSLTPVEIEFLMWCYYCPQPHPRENSEALKSATRRFLDEGLIDPENGSFGVHYRVTPRGTALVKMLCSTPFPVEAWVDPSTGKVVK